MKVYDFRVQVAAPDDADESQLFEQVRFFVAELSGDGTLVPPTRGQARAVLNAETSLGEDVPGGPEWNEQACEAIQKYDLLDLFTDMRGRTERRRHAR